MDQTRRRLFYLLYVLLTASFVYVAGHWNALTNPYVIHDDVRAVVYWMEQWQDPQLFQDDILTRYAINYVPWGVRTVYRVGSLFMDPVQFSKVVTGVLWLISAGFLFGLGLQFRNELTAISIVFVSFFFTGFIRQISGGIAKGFAYPLLTGYLFFLSRGNLLGASLVILMSSVLIPYMFIICTVTHILYLLWNHGRDVLGEIRVAFSGPRGEEGGAQKTQENALSSSGSAESTVLDTPEKRMPLRRLVVLHLPVIAGALLMGLKYVLFTSDEIGTLVSWSDMAGKLEYTAAGRVQIVPSPPFWYELVRPWINTSPFLNPGPVWGWGCMIACLVVAILAWQRRDKIVDLGGFRVFVYLLPASLMLYIASRVFLAKMFLPDRYLDYSLTVFYCAILAVCFTILIRTVWSRRNACLLAVMITLLAAVRTYDIAIYDYSRDVPLYNFLKTTPKDTLIAGNPEVMDNVPTFAYRKAFVMYELSHTWLEPYWSVIKKRTYDFFRAYYSEDPEEIRSFSRYYGIDYLVVRDEDFSKDYFKKDEIYFEPFGTFVRELTANRTHFAALGEKSFPIVYRGNGIRVLRIGDSHNPSPASKPVSGRDARPLFTGG